MVLPASAFFKKVVPALDDLRTSIGSPSEVVLRKELRAMDQHCRDWIARTPFVLVATASQDGRCDVSPRGDAPGFVLVLDEKHLAIPERPGNRRVDSMRNLLENPQIGLLFVIPGVEEFLRINGRAWVVADDDILDRTAAQGKRPAFAIGVEVQEVFIHCAKAAKRSSLWEPAGWPTTAGLPSVGQILKDHARIAGHTAAEIDQDLQADYKALY